MRPRRNPSHSDLHRPLSVCSFEKESGREETSCSPAVAFARSVFNFLVSVWCHEVLCCALWPHALKRFFHGSTTVFLNVFGHSVVTGQLRPEKMSCSACFFPPSHGVCSMVLPFRAFLMRPWTSHGSKTRATWFSFSVVDFKRVRGPRRRLTVACCSLCSKLLMGRCHCRGADIHSG